MPLPPAVPRDALHLRRIDVQGWRRADGLYDIEAHMVDTKHEARTLESGRRVAAGEAVHDMSIRVTVDAELNVHDIVASIDASPYTICPQAAAAMQSIRGLRIGAGWSAAVRERLAGRAGCTHLRELLGPLATVAFQTLSEVRRSQPTPVDASGRPRKIDSCYAYASDREVVRQRWPLHHDGGPHAAPPDTRHRVQPAGPAPHGRHELPE